METRCAGAADVGLLAFQRPLQVLHPRRQAFERGHEPGLELRDLIGRQTGELAELGLGTELLPGRDLLAVGGRQRPARARIEQVCVLVHQHGDETRFRRAGRSQHAAGNSELMQDGEQHGRAIAGSAEAGAKNVGRRQSFLGALVQEDAAIDPAGRVFRLLKRLEPGDFQHLGCVAEENRRIEVMSVERPVRLRLDLDEIVGTEPRFFQPDSLRCRESEVRLFLERRVEAAENIAAGADGRRGPQIFQGGAGLVGLAGGGFLRLRGADVPRATGHDDNGEEQRHEAERVHGFLRIGEHPKPRDERG